jgi:uncharacterized Zn finger protein
MSAGWWEQHGPRLPANGILAKTRRGAFGASWWAGRWVAALERLVNPGRLARGRSYARSGQVLSLEVGPAGVSARVQGSRPAPYAVSIHFQPLPADAWERVVAAMADEAIYAARLLSGEMPEDVEALFEAAGASLFPADQRDMRTSCSCPDDANPCKHIAAVHYLLGERFDADPFLMFQLRGRGRAEIVDALRQRRSAPDLRHFWTTPNAPEVALKFGLPEADALALKQLGPAPFVQDQPAFLAAMEQTYRAISQHALRLALDDTEGSGLS